MPTLRDMALMSEPLHGSDTAEDALRIFESIQRLPLIAVVDDDGVPVGQIERQAFLLAMSGQYGHAVFTRRPVELLMRRDTLVLEAGGKLADARQVAQDLHRDGSGEGQTDGDAGQRQQKSRSDRTHAMLLTAPEPARD